MNPAFCYIYLLFSLKDNKLHIGYSDNLKQRIQDHMNGKVRATKYRRPLKLIHFEAFGNIKNGKVKERFLKSGYGRDQLKQALKNQLSKLDYKYL